MDLKRLVSLSAISSSWPIINFKSVKYNTTHQYKSDGGLLSSAIRHSTLGTGYSSINNVTKNLLDKIGWVTDTAEKFGANGFKAINHTCMRIPED